MNDHWRKALRLSKRLARGESSRPAQTRRPVSKGGMPDELKDAYYCRGILRRRLSYCDEAMALKLLTDAVSSGIDGADLKRLCKEVCNWTEFRDTINSWIDEVEAA